MIMPQWPVPGSYHNIELGLGRINALLERLGNPHFALPPVVHVAGTNGKGSTIAFMRAMFEAQGLKVHIYTSPHLVDFNERYIVAGQQVTDEALNAALDVCKQAAGDDISLTFFEAVTAAAFVLFAEHEADVVLLETGLGGRLDATNVMVKPAATVITPVSVDHEEFLGDDVVQIAGEKAGIMKPDVPCFVAEQLPEVVSALQAKAREVKCDVQIITADESLSHLGLVGKHQQQNAVLARAVVEHLGLVSDEAIEQGMRNVKWRARMQQLVSGGLIEQSSGRADVWLDGGHNPAAGLAVAAMAEGWNDKPLYVMCAMLAGKDVQGFVLPFANYAKKIYAVPIVDESAALAPQLFVDEVAKAGVDAVVSDSLDAAMDEILSLESGDFRLLICGSLYLAGTVLAYNA